MLSSNDPILSRIFPRNWAFVGWCLFSLLLLPLSGYLLQHVLQVNGVLIEAGFADLYGNEGSLVIAGGGELPESIPNHFLNLAGGAKARLVVIPSYDATPNEEREIIREWRQRKVANVDVARCRTRGDTASDLLIRKIRNATAVWFTGGQQKITAEYYPGTAVEEELHSLLERGGVIGGTSAGAAIMSRVMIEEGRREAKTSQGLDLFRGVVIDQHFMQRNRLTRLRGVLDRHPKIIGIGIDEGTALVVDASNGRVRVIGKSYVMLWAPAGEGAPHRAEFLKSGDTYDLDQLDWMNEPIEFVDPSVLELEPPLVIEGEG
jgi:cyanophycinase